MKVWKVPFIQDYQSVKKEYRLSTPKLNFSKKVEHNQDTDNWFFNKSSQMKKKVMFVGFIFTKGRIKWMVSVQEERGCAINVVSCHRKICRRTNDWTTSLWKWKRSGNWPAWGGNWWWFVNEAKFYFWKIFSEHTDWFWIFLRWDLLVESKFQFLPGPEAKKQWKR